MTDATATDPVPPRIVLLNAAPGAGGRELARYLNLRWDAAMLPVDDIELALERGRPVSRVSREAVDQDVLRRALLQVGGTLAHAYRPLVVAAMTITTRFELDSMLQGWRQRSVQVAHVVMSAAEDELRARIHERGGDTDARRWALQHVRDTTRDLAVIPADVPLDTTGLGLDALAAALMRGLVGLGWLDDDGRWLGATTSMEWTDA